MKNKYRVQSGNLDIVIEARTNQLAIFKALENYVGELGVIISSLIEGGNEDDELFMKTEYALKVIGSKLEDE